jgi:hypothetical protein
MILQRQEAEGTVDLARQQVAALLSSMPFTVGMNAAKRAHTP